MGSRAWAEATPKRLPTRALRTTDGLRGPAQPLVRASSAATPTTFRTLHTAENSHLVRVPLTELEQDWAEAGFVRIHRSILIAI